MCTIADRDVSVDSGGRALPGYFSIEMEPVGNLASSIRRSDSGGPWASFHLIPRGLAIPTPIEPGAYEKVVSRKEDDPEMHFSNSARNWSGCLFSSSLE